MLWSDPWIEVATTKGILAPICTRLAPPCDPLPPYFIFRVMHRPPPGWRRFIGTSWTMTELKQRLAGAQIACLFYKQRLVGTCVLRLSSVDHLPLWILETLVARGYGALFMRQTMRWLWNRSGPFVLGYTWELTPFQFVWAWMRGWLRSANQIHFGWKWSAGRRHQSEKRLAMPMRFRTLRGSAIVSDSGLQDGWGYVQEYSDEPDWNTIAKKGGWSKLWTHSISPPSGWSWSGEIVVIGLLNYCGNSDPEWITPEIAFSM